MQPLTFEYNTEAHRCTNKSPYIFVFNGQSFGPSLSRVTTDIPAYSKFRISLQLMRRTIQVRILVLRTSVHALMCKFQLQYKVKNDWRVLEISHFPPNAYVFLGNLPLRASSNSTADVVAVKEWTNFQYRYSDNTEPFHYRTNLLR